MPKAKPVSKNSKNKKSVKSTQTRRSSGVKAKKVAPPAKSVKQAKVSQKSTATKKTVTSKSKSVKKVATKKTSTAAAKKEVVAKKRTTKRVVQRTLPAINFKPYALLVVAQLRKLVVQVGLVQQAVSAWASRHAKLLAVIGIFLSLQIMIASGWYLLYRRTILSFQVVPTVTAEQHKEVPTRLEISGQAIDLPIIQGIIENNIWQVSDAGALHLATSAYPGEKGNIVMYGHNKTKLLGKLHNVKKGDEISVITDAGYKYTYTVEEILNVAPSQIEVVMPTDFEVLTVYTCTGMFDSRRLVVKAKPTAISVVPAETQVQ